MLSKLEVFCRVSEISLRKYIFLPLLFPHQKWTCMYNLSLRSRETTVLS